jgi:hypothetical protein
MHPSCIYDEDSRLPILTVAGSTLRPSATGRRSTGTAQIRSKNRQPSPARELRHDGQASTREVKHVTPTVASFGSVRSATGAWVGLGTVRWRCIHRASLQRNEPPWLVPKDGAPRASVNAALACCLTPCRGLWPRAAAARWRPGFVAQPTSLSATSGLESIPVANMARLATVRFC